MKLITVTGTKGKTTVVRLLDHIFQGLFFNTLRVDTDGHYVNGKQESNYEISKKIWGVVPNVCPGRYLFELQNMDLKNTVAILEAAIGSSSLSGLGYSRHNIGIFTNIFEDHITKMRIKNRKDIYKAKRFIFERLKEDGTLILNGADDFLAENMKKEKKIPGKKIIIGEKESFGSAFFNEKQDALIEIEGNDLFFYRSGEKNIIFNLEEIPLTFKGLFMPNVYNIAFVAAAMIAYFGEKFFWEKRKDIFSLMKDYKVNKEGGRLVFLKDKISRKKVIIDFAHEKESLKQIALLAKNFGKKVWGVLRLDPSRINEDIFRTAEYIYPFYDFINIYDKVDGAAMKESWLKAEGKKRGIGETAAKFAEGLKKSGYNNFKVILKEKDAFLDAFNKADKGDIIVYIDNGSNHKKAYEFVKKIINNQK